MVKTNMHVEKGIKTEKQAEGRFLKFSPTYFLWRVCVLGVTVLNCDQQMLNQTIKYDGT